MALKCLTILAWVCALYSLISGLIDWDVAVPPLVPKQWESTPSVSVDAFSALGQLALQITTKQSAGYDVQKRVRVAPVKPTAAEPSITEIILIRRGPGKQVKVLVLEEVYRENILGQRFPRFTVKQNAKDAFRRSRVSLPICDGPCSPDPELEKEEKVSLRRRGVRNAVEMETERTGFVTWAFSFQRLCLLVVIGILARITIGMLLQVKSTLTAML